MIDFNEILKSKQLSLTKGRLKLLEVLSKTSFPLSGKDIEKRINSGCDRATIYRNLNVLSSKGIIQRILSGDSVKFKFNPDAISLDTGNDHVHFQCSICHKVFCLENLKVQEYLLPKGFTREENQFLIIGLCNDCNENK